jgi:hypothetical protein
MQNLASDEPPRSGKSAAGAASLRGSLILIPVTLMPEMAVTVPVMEAQTNTAFTPTLMVAPSAMFKSSLAPVLMARLADTNSEARAFNAHALGKGRGGGSKHR